MISGDDFESQMLSKYRVYLLQKYVCWNGICCGRSLAFKNLKGVLNRGEGRNVSFIFLCLGRPSHVVVGSHSGGAAWGGGCAMLLQLGDWNDNVSRSFKNKKKGSW